jgi:hypothetical protein
MKNHEKRLQLAGVEQRRPKSDRRQPLPSFILHNTNYGAFICSS